MIMRKAYWPLLECFDLLKMKASRMPRAAIATHFGVTVHAVEMKAMKLRRSADMATGETTPRLKPGPNPLRSEYLPRRSPVDQMRAGLA